MKNPRATSAGPVTTGALNSLGSDEMFIPETGPAMQRRHETAKHLDREADVQLCLGRHSIAERLSHRAVMLREAVL